MSAFCFRLFLLPLLALLGSCSVFHSGQKDKLRMPAAMEAEYKAKEKARHKGLTYRAPEESTNNTDTGDKAKKDPNKPLTYKNLSENTRTFYDKQGLIRNHLSAPTPRHTYETHALKGNKVNKEARKRQKSKKGKDKEPGAGKEAAEPDKDPTAPAPQPEEVPKGN